ncbi:aminotransferase class IV [Coralloluteibacterium thermophilus]|uniref:Aminotransferase class IV n=1 Tax=Coralloluteibacterium thermophilum TaxID=2707049 RepID=A0ABV9NHC5_9GAMM
MPPAARLELNGRPAGAADLAALAGANYGHFTTMQVRAGAVRGLDLHLGRLAEATEVLFARPLDRDGVRGWLRQALAGSDAPCTLRATVFSRGFDRRHPERAAAPDVLVSTAPPAPAGAPLRVRSVLYRRELPAIKHLGTFPVLHHLREARQAGFDDILLIDDAGHVAEGSFWSVCFVEEGRVVWPDAPALRGVTERLVEAGLARAGVACVREPVRMADLPRFQGAFALNAGGIRPVVAIDGLQFDRQDPWAARLFAALESQPAERI